MGSRKAVGGWEIWWEVSSHVPTIVLKSHETQHKKRQDNHVDSGELKSAVCLA